MGLAPGEGGLAVILHLFSISAGSAEICVGIKDGKEQRIDFLAFGLQDKHSKLNHSLEFFDGVNGERKEPAADSNK